MVYASNEEALRSHRAKPFINGRVPVRRQGCFHPSKSRKLTSWMRPGAVGTHRFVAHSPDGTSDPVNTGHPYGQPASGSRDGWVSVSSWPERDRLKWNNPKTRITRQNKVPDHDRTRTLIQLQTIMVQVNRPASITSNKPPGGPPRPCQRRRHCRPIYPPPP